MDDTRRTRVSKYLSLHLRHHPERLGLTLAPGGWVEVAALLAASAARGFPITREELSEVVARSDKQRFAFDETGARIRANQGHSVQVDLQLEPAVPPERLYHGTGHGSAGAVSEGGLRPMSRHHVHLSADEKTARAVGARHGRPVIFSVAAGDMHRAGHVFYCSANGVWLCDHVPPAYLRRL